MFVVTLFINAASRIWIGLLSTVSVFFLFIFSGIGSTLLWDSIGENSTFVGDLSILWKENLLDSELGSWSWFLEPLRILARSFEPITEVKIDNLEFVYPNKWYVSQSYSENSLFKYYNASAYRVSHVNLLLNETFWQFTYYS